MSQSWYVKSGEEIVGPMNAKQLEQLAADGKIRPTTPLRIGEDGSWVEAGKVKGLLSAATAKSQSQESAPTRPTSSGPSQPVVGKTSPVTSPEPSPTKRNNTNIVLLVVAAIGAFVVVGVPVLYFQSKKRLITLGTPVSIYPFT